VWDGDRYLYAHRARYHELHRYDLETQSWDTAFAGMPFMGMKVQWKKSKGGGSAVWVDSLIFALKGGNSQEFWMYSPAANEWAELETIPAYGSTERKKRVRHGADVVFAEGAFYALKGNRTVELWCYVMRPEDTVWGVAGRRKAALDGGFGEETICEGVEAERPRWSPNGQYICYFKDVDGYNQIFMKEYGSQEPEVQLTDIETDCENPVFSLQNDWIAFQMDDTVEGFWQICRVSTSESDWGGVDGRTPEGSVSTSGFPTAADPCVSAEVSPVHQAPAEVPGLDYDIEQLTTVTEADHENPEYSPDGTKLAFQRDLDGYYQICIMSSEGGDVTQLTTDEADHEWPVWLDNNTIVYQKWPDEDYVQLYKVDVVTQTETWLTNGNFDHELPCADSGSQVTYQVMDDDGVYQIGLV
ncbi:MAG: PD40 domain-containing protein, partial [candidate division WOR-3 bacterium]